MTARAGRFGGEQREVGPMKRLPLAALADLPQTHGLVRLVDFSDGPFVLTRGYGSAVAE